MSCTDPALPPPPPAASKQTLPPQGMPTSHSKSILEQMAEELASIRQSLASTKSQLILNGAACAEIERAVVAQGEKIQRVEHRNLLLSNELAAERKRTLEAYEQKSAVEALLLAQSQRNEELQREVERLRERGDVARKRDWRGLRKRVTGMLARTQSLRLDEYEQAASVNTSEIRVRSRAKPLRVIQAGIGHIAGSQLLHVFFASSWYLGELQAEYATHLNRALIRSATMFESHHRITP
uniref:Pericentrin/AKAP-450 centrosomal targeting domain-containing protein n=1 Tax=Mycena chlorophos TaxID=658473 RepID=A0ABQ0LWT4_MYCCL|nr:predicted protein [Mycena chlorophos]